MQLTDISTWATIHFQFAKYTSVHLQVNCGLQGLLQSRLLTQKKLKTYLTDYCFIESVRTPCHFTHISDPIEYVLVADKMGIRTSGNDLAEHIFAAIHKQNPSKVCVSVLNSWVFDWNSHTPTTSKNVNVAYQYPVMLMRLLRDSLCALQETQRIYQERTGMYVRSRQRKK